MPSWRLHERWAERLGIPSWIAREVDQIIDAGRRHDAGKIKRERLLKEIFGVNVDTGPKVDVDTSGELWRELIKRFHDKNALILAVKASYLHHLLDSVRDVIKSFGNKPLSQVPPEGIIMEAERRMRVGVILKQDPTLNHELYEEVRGFILRNAAEIVNDIISELGSRRDISIGSDLLADLFELWRREKNLPTFIFIQGRSLPYRAAAYEIWSLLSRGEAVKFYFVCKRGFSSLQCSQTFTFSSVRELADYIARELGYTDVEELLNKYINK